MEETKDLEALIKEAEKELKHIKFKNLSECVHKYIKYKLLEPFAAQHYLYLQDLTVLSTTVEVYATGIHFTKNFINKSAVLNNIDFITIEEIEESDFNTELYTAFYNIKCYAKLTN